ncbi:hypothetical protein [Vibrio vulnificus YJ016]|uniref:Uncharacterized protein n=1 Tax=Vibrio vulnificus (strain YJ016) TaxID=196600 RepID=Q7MJM0_VIBVY|nr:hypothetical protein [Vibrio vulnificus YJ016]
MAGVRFVKEKLCYNLPEESGALANIPLSHHRMAGNGNMVMRAYMLMKRCFVIFGVSD